MKDIELFNDHSNEECRNIECYENYQVSSTGRIRSKDRIVEQFGHKQSYKRLMKGKIIKPGLQNCGYLIVWLCKNGKSKAFTVHRIVANSFFGHSDKKDVNHIDGNRLNNSIYNLEWTTRSENIKHSYEHLKRKSTGMKIKCIETGEIFASIIDAGKKHNTNSGSIGHVLAGRNKTAGGYTWKKI